MMFSVCYIFLIAVCILPETYSKAPECVGCSFYGTTKKGCGEIVPAAKLPSECEALYFYWIHTNASLVISDISINDVPLKKFIDDLDSVGKPMYLYYGRRSIQELMSDIASNTKDGGAKAKCEMQNLKTYLGQFKNIAGLVLVRLLPYPDTKCIPDYSENLKIYIDEMKKTLSSLAVGIEITSADFLDYSSNPPKCKLDFTVIDPSVDFYILDLFYFNDCTEAYKIGGSVPISGGGGRTLDQLVTAYKKAKIPQNKVYFGYRSGPTPLDPATDMCNVTNTQLCLNKNLDGVCADNTLSYFKKGTFAKNNGAGFVMSNVDVADDPNGVCKCETSYPAFHDVLAGFKSLPTPKPCPLLDKC